MMESPAGAMNAAATPALVTWTEAHQNEIAAARAEYDRRAAEPAAGAALARS
jgi:hypothetical protein